MVLIGRRRVAALWKVLDIDSSLILFGCAGFDRNQNRCRVW